MSRPNNPLLLFYEKQVNLGRFWLHKKISYFDLSHVVEQKDVVKWQTGPAVALFH